jgi:hypothetical protein
MHTAVWGDAADRAAEAVYYKATRAGNSCVRSESPGFSHDDLLILPSYLQFHRDRSTVRMPSTPHSGDAVMLVSGHTTDQAVIATMTVGTVLGVFAVAARLFTRIVIVRKAGWDDAIICAGCVSPSMLVRLVQSLTLPRSSPSHIPLSLAKDVSVHRSIRM